MAVLAAVALVALLVAVLAVTVARRAVARFEALAREVRAVMPSPEAGTETALAAEPEPVDETAAFVITDAGADRPADDDRSVLPERIDGRLFVDIVARETLVKAASWGHGLRRALAPETRNRIRFEVRQQARQSRKDRKVEMREALREYRARRGTSTETSNHEEDAA